MKMKGLVFFIKYIWICRKFVIIYNLKKDVKSKWRVVDLENI